MARQKQALLYLSAARVQQIGRQRSAVKKYAASQQLEIVDEYTDDLGAASRPGLGGLLMGIRDQKVKLVLIAKTEFLGETLVQQQSVIGLIVHRGAKVIDCSTGDCVSTGGSDDAQLIRETVSVVEELRRQTVGGRLSESRKTGAKVGRKPYGHYPNEAPIVELIMQLRRKRGWGVRRVANELNRRGIVNRAGGQWQPTAIQRIFDREA